MEHKNQHWIPQSYLEAWCDPETPEKYTPYVWVFDKDGLSSKRKSPQNLFCESEMYTIYLDDGTRNLEIENGLCGLEQSFSEVRKHVISKQMPITPKDKLTICAFIAATRARTRSNREHWKEQWGELLEQMEDLNRWAQQATPEQRENLASIGSLTDGPKFGIEHVRKLAETPLQEQLIPSIVSETRILAKMSLAILSTEDKPGFITSDDPCVCFDSEAYKRPFPYNNVGLGFKSVEVTLPISPKQLALLSWSQLIGYSDVPQKIVDEFNRRTRAYAEDYFVVNRNEMRKIWLDLGKRPE